MLVALEGDACHREARNCRPLALKEIRVVLDPPVAEGPARSASEGPWNPGADSEDGEFQRPLGRAPGARRAPETGNRHLGEDCFSVDAEKKEATVANLESVSVQPRRRPCVDRLLHGPDGDVSRTVCPDSPCA